MSSRSDPRIRGRVAVQTLEGKRSQSRLTDTVIWEVKSCSTMSLPNVETLVETMAHPADWTAFLHIPDGNKNPEHDDMGLSNMVHIHEKWQFG